MSTSSRGGVGRLIRLLAELRMWAAEIGRGGILADLDDAAAYRAGAGEMLVQGLAVAAPDRTGEFCEILVESAEHIEHRVLVGQEHVAPHRRVGCGDAREVAKAAGGKLQHFGLRDAFKLIRRAYDGIGDPMRRM